jgi:hypothetical protein
VTLEETLQLPDREISKSGECVMIIVREWNRLTGREPDACDCKFKTYLSYVRQDFKNRTMAHNDVYYNGQYYDRTMSEEKKAEILKTDERLYVRLFGSLPVTKPVKSPKNVKK